MSSKICEGFVFIRSLSQRQHGLIEEYVKEEMRHIPVKKTWQLLGVDFRLNTFRSFIAGSTIVAHYHHYHQIVLNIGSEIYNFLSILDSQLYNYVFLTQRLINVFSY